MLGKIYNSYKCELIHRIFKEINSKIYVLISTTDISIKSIEISYLLN